VRLTVEIGLKSKPPFLIPTAYRRNIVSFIREAVRLTDTANDIYNKYWGNSNTQSVKPYTFFLSVPDINYISLNKRRYIELNKNSVKLHISSSDPDFLSILYKWLSSDNNKSFKLFNSNVEVAGINLKNEKRINSRSATFKILSPVIVRDTELEGKKRRGMGYLSCNNSDFEDSLAHSILTLCKCFLYNKKINRNDIEIDASLCAPSIIYHYMETIPVTIGMIGIKANEDVLDLIYNSGLGARRSQGFGMIELVSESNYDLIPVMKEPA
jgi:CRISPR-associated endoribonuclease Cas6